MFNNCVKCLHRLHASITTSNNTQQPQRSQRRSDVLCRPHLCPPRKKRPPSAMNNTGRNLFANRDLHYRPKEDSALEAGHCGEPHSSDSTFPILFVYLLFPPQSDKKSHRVDRPSLMNTEGRRREGDKRSGERELPGKGKIRGRGEQKHLSLQMLALIPSRERQSMCG